MRHIQLSAIVLVILTAGYGCTSANNALLYANYETDQYSQTDFWCGNRSRSSGAMCQSKATDSRGKIPARMIEVRGWVVSAPFYNEAENEFIFSLRLDHGWTQVSPVEQYAEAVNTPARINQVITPHNMIAFGIGSASAATAWLGNNAWGGQNALTLHVEINGWGRRSGTASHRARVWPPPDGWLISSGTPAQGATPGVAWSFDPWDPPSINSASGPIASGDYVRMVGLLWEDAPHEDSNEGRTGADASRTVDSKRCWKHARHDQGLVGRGFSEMHPVDYLARIEPVIRKDVLFAVALCDDASLVHQIYPPGQPSRQGAQVGYEEFVDSEFTNLGSVMRKRVRVMNDHIEIDLVTRNRTNGTRGKLKALYRVFWVE